jgi:hypothetical protein
MSRSEYRRDEPESASFAQLGDTIECKQVTSPLTLRARLDTHEAVAYANELLVTQPGVWTIVRRWPTHYDGGEVSGLSMVISPLVR